MRGGVKLNAMGWMAMRNEREKEQRHRGGGGQRSDLLVVVRLSLG